MKQLGILMGMHRIRTTPGNPRSNGLVENHNRVLKSMLPQYTNAYQSNLDEYLTLCQFQYNTTVHSQTGYTPFFMIFGREAKQPCNEWIEKYAQQNNLTEYISNIVQAMANAWRIVGDNKPKQAEAFNKIPFKRLAFVEYKVGDKFYRAVQPAPTYRQ